MGLQRHADHGGKAPDKPHLAVTIDKDTGDLLAIPPGAVMHIITDPTKKDGVLPIVLLLVSPKRLVFGCACKSPSCNVRYEFRASRSGNHVNARR